MAMPRLNVRGPSTQGRLHHPGEQRCLPSHGLPPTPVELPGYEGGYRLHGLRSVVALVLRYRGLGKGATVKVHYGVVTSTQ
ncbi:MAG: hypothetical protein JRH20_24605 [Deltaproteobacteria bacterium]|nr:hypothetical protein [Deltaproteobacteria bacterium]